MFSPEQSALDLCEAVDFGRLLLTPLQPGVWSLLEPVDVQNHAPQLCWLRHDCLACVWMAGGQGGPAGMSIQMSLLTSGSNRWTSPQRILVSHPRSEQNPLLFVSDGHLHLIHTAQRSRDPEDLSWQEQDSSFSMQWTAQLRRQQLPLNNLEPEKFLTWAAEAWSSPEDLLETPAFCRHPPHPLPLGLFLLPLSIAAWRAGTLELTTLSCCALMPLAGSREHRSRCQTVLGGCTVRSFQLPMAMDCCSCSAVDSPIVCTAL